MGQVSFLSSQYSCTYPSTLMKFQKCTNFLSYPTAMGDGELLERPTENTRTLYLVRIYQIEVFACR